MRETLTEKTAELESMQNQRDTLLEENKILIYKMTEVESRCAELAESTEVAKKNLQLSTSEVEVVCEFILTS